VYSTGDNRKERIKTRELVQLVEGKKSFRREVLYGKIILL